MCGIFIAASAGIGGGGLNVPLFIIFFNFLIAEAIPLSHAAVMANSVAQFIINWNKKHPEADRPSVDYFAPLILLPAQLGGNNIGVLAGAVLPPNLLYCLSIVLLCCVCTKVGYKAYQTYLKENALEESNQKEAEEGLLDTVEQGSPTVNTRADLSSYVTNLLVTNDEALNEEVSFTDSDAIVIDLTVVAVARSVIIE